MTNQELLDYIKQSLSRRIPVEQIKNALLKAGWQMSTIDEALKEVTLKSDSEKTKQLPKSSFLKSPSFKILIILMITLALGVTVFLDYTHKKKEAAKEIQPLESALKEKLTSENKGNLIIVFRESSGHLEGGKVVFYNTATQSRLDDIPNFTKTDLIYTLGPWSPSGRYLPIHASVPVSEPIEKQVGRTSLFIYDSKNHTAQKIYTLSEDEEYGERITHSHISISSWWMDEERLVYQHNRNAEENKVTIKYITRDGVREEFITTENYKLKNNLLTIEYLPINQESGEREINQIQFRGQTINFKPEGQIIGVVNNSIVSIKQAKPKFDIRNLFTGEIDPELKAELEKLEEETKIIESSDLGEEEKSQKIAELTDSLTKPIGPSTIYLTNINTGEIESDFSISNEWVVRNIQLHPKQSLLFIQETNRDILPSKHRIVKVSLENPQDREVIVSGDITSWELPGYLLLEEGVTFHITADGNWLVYYESKDTQDPMKADTMLLSLSNKEKTIICRNYCRYKVHNPGLFKIKY